jgi:hypothetical protein
MEVAGDAGAFLRGCEATLALGLPLGARDAFHKVCETRAPLPETVAEDPGAAPDNGSEEERHDGKFAWPMPAAPMWTTNKPTMVAAITRGPARA